MQRITFLCPACKAKNSCYACSTRADVPDSCEECEHEFTPDQRIEIAEEATHDYQEQADEYMHEQYMARLERSA